MNDLPRLAELIKARTAIDNQIAALIGRPAERGHTGEYIAAAVFGITLQESAAHKGSDGYFTAGPLAGRAVNIKWYGKQSSIIDLNPDGMPDDYLVFTGPKSGPGSSRGLTNPWVIESVFLLDAAEVVALLRERGRRIGIATGLPRQLWQAAEIYPVARNPRLTLTEAQRAALTLFGPPPAP